MKGVILKFILIISVCCSRADDVLYWFIGEEAPEFENARLLIGMNVDGKIEGGSFATNYEINGWWEDEYVYDERAYVGSPSVQAADLGDAYAGLSFMVELYMDGNVTHTSEIFSLDDLHAYITSIDDFNSGWRYIAPLQIFSFSAPGAVPEPCEGTLMLIGGALLALRRKKRAK